MGTPAKDVQGWDKPPVPTPEFDRFLTEEEWFVPAVDEDGHGAREYVQIPPRMSRKLEVMIQAANLPYKTRSDLLRHALYRHLHWLEWIRNSGQVDQLMLGIEAGIEVCREEYTASRSRLLMEHLRDRVTDHLAGGNRNDAIRTYMHVRGIVERTHDSVWRTQLLTSLTDLYHNIIERWGDRSIPVTRSHLNHSTKLRPRLVTVPDNRNRPDSAEGEEEPE